MKTSSGTINQTIVSKPFASRPFSFRNIFLRLYQKINGFLYERKETILNIVATLTIGAIFLTSFYLFLCQLAESGW